MKELKLYTATGIPEALSNIFGRGSTVADLRDAAEDSCTGNELLNRLRALDLFGTYTLDRETPEYVRIKVTDRCGNVSYLEAQKPQKTIVIETWRGLVEAVYAEDADIRVFIRGEEQCPKLPKGVKLPKHRVY